MHDAERGGASRSKLGEDLQISLSFAARAGRTGVARRAVKTRYFALTTSP
jgi:hypothetical protein